MIKSRTDSRRKMWAIKGGKRNGSSKGYRVAIYATDSETADAVVLSVYPEDARKFAVELMRIADECEG